MSEQAIGQSCALLCALVWAFALVLFKQSTAQIPPLALNLFKNTVALVLFVVTLALLHALGWDELDALRTRTGWDVGVLALSGVIGIALADTIFFHALRLIGVGLISIVDCAYAPSVVLFSWLLLSEQISVVHYLGGALIVAGVFLASRHEPPPDRTRAQIVLGMLLAPLAVALMAFGIVMAKPALDGFPLLWATAIRVLGGAIALVIFAACDPGRQLHWRVFRPSASWKTAVPASVLGAFLSMILWVAAFKYTEASIAGILSQTSVVFAMFLATVVLKETFDRRKAVALVLAIAGVAVVKVGDRIVEKKAARGADVAMVSAIDLPPAPPPHEETEPTADLEPTVPP